MESTALFSKENNVLSEKEVHNPKPDKRCLNSSMDIHDALLRKTDEVTSKIWSSFLVDGRNLDSNLKLRSGPNLEPESDLDPELGSRVKNLVSSRGDGQVLDANELHSPSNHNATVDLQIETDSIGTMELLENIHQTYNSTILPCKSTLKKSRNSLVRHSFH
ncbi:hypothetical protein H5410_011412 [Solanum commersonii]|uniref:Uncharacterized protein n=1 Tax=Solanum commersonii TaxID=4109 RepID=A0A9J6APV5_SOLCO|nr:hypothetical protein H5410_011412 [Solanum commersonii]